MADTEPRRDIFNFFGLPREMRDSIYAELLTGSQEIRNETYAGLKVIVQHLALNNLLLINRQFRKEYSISAEKVFGLVVEDHLEDQDNWIEPRIPANARGIERLHLRLYAVCIGPQPNSLSPDKFFPDIASHYERFLEWVARMPHLRRLTVDLHIERPNREVAEQTKQAVTRECGELTSIEHARALDVYYSSFEDLNQEDWDYSKGEGPVMRWVAETGVMEGLEQAHATEVSGVAADTEAPSG